MFRNGAILLVSLGVLSTGCMTLRDRIAMRYGLPKSSQSSSHLAQRRVKLPSPYDAEFEKLYAQATPRPEPTVALVVPTPPVRPVFTATEERFVEPVRVTVSPAHPDPLQEMERERSQFHARLERYEMEREAARFRWEASLLRLQAEQLREQVASLDSLWNELSEKVAQMESDRIRIREAMAKVEEELDRARVQAKALEEKRSQLISFAAPSR